MSAQEMFKAEHLDLTNPNTMGVRVLAKAKGMPEKALKQLNSVFRSTVASQLETYRSYIENTVTAVRELEIAVCEERAETERINNWTAKLKLCDLHLYQVNPRVKVHRSVVDARRVYFNKNGELLNDSASYPYDTHHITGFTMKNHLGEWVYGLLFLPFNMALEPSNQNNNAPYYKPQMVFIKMRSEGELWLSVKDDGKEVDYSALQMASRNGNTYLPYYLTYDTNGANHMLPYTIDIGSLLEKIIGHADFYGAVLEVIEHVTKLEDAMEEKIKRAANKTDTVAGNAGAAIPKFNESAYIRLQQHWSTPVLSPIKKEPPVEASVNRQENPKPAPNQLSNVNLHWGGQITPIVSGGLSRDQNGLVSLELDDNPIRMIFETDLAAENEHDDENGGNPFEPLRTSPRRTRNSAAAAAQPATQVTCQHCRNIFDHWVTCSRCGCTLCPPHSYDVMGSILCERCVGS